MYLCFVGRGPSLNTCPKCEPQFEHKTSVLWRPINESFLSSTDDDEAGAKKLGQPVPLLNFVDEVNKVFPQPLHVNSPGLFSSLSDDVQGLSVPAPLST